MASKISNEALATIGCCKTRLIQDFPERFRQMQNIFLALEKTNRSPFGARLTSQEKEAMMDGAALMSLLINKSEFSKEFE